jgi:hypothetical protein
MIFVVGGAYLVDKLNTGQSTINFVIGCIFALTAIILVLKIFMKKPLDETIAEKASQLEAAEHEHHVR